MRKVYLAVLNQGYIRVDLANNLMVAQTRCSYPVHITWPNLKPIAHNRNQIAKNFLETDSTHLIMIDSDVVPPVNIFDLVGLNKDIIAAPCPQWHENDIYWVVMDEVEGGFKAIPPERRNGLQKVDAVGTGCIVIKREVLEQVKAPFMRYWNEDGLAEIGLDFYFCKKARELGFDVWAHFDFPCRHYTEQNLIDVLKLVIGGDKNE